MASSVQSVAASIKDGEMLPELPAMGWTVEEEHLTEADVCMHHCLVGVLVNYYEDWEDVWVQYICLHRTHPLEATRWKSTVGVFIGNKLESQYDELREQLLLIHAFLMLCSEVVLEGRM